MNTLFTMTLTGSAMTLCYLAGKSVLKQSLSHTRRYLWLNLTLIAYAMPMYFVRYLYDELLSLLPVSDWSQQAVYRTQHDYIVFTDPQHIALSNAIQHELSVMAVWSGLSLTVLVYRLAEHYRGRKKVIAMHQRYKTDCWTVDPGLAARYGIRRKVTVYGGDPDCRSYSIGILHPVIFLGQMDTVRTEEAVLHHELVHISRYDTVWLMLDIIVSCIHWYNPLMYLMVRERLKICEMSNDDIVTADMPVADRQLYAMTVSYQASIGGSQLAFAQNLSKNGYQLKERIDNIMSDKSRHKWISVSSAVFMAVSIFASSLTVFAYEDVERVNADYGFTGRSNDMLYLPEGEEDKNPFFVPPDILYDRQFTDREGNIYEAGYQDSGTCSHEYDPGTVLEHSRDGDGCILYSRFAQRCRLCGYTKAGKEEYTGEFVNCPHN